MENLTFSGTRAVSCDDIIYLKNTRRRSKWRIYRGNTHGALAPLQARSGYHGILSWYVIMVYYHYYMKEGQEVVEEGRTRSRGGSKDKKSARSVEESSQISIYARPFIQQAAPGVYTTYIIA